MPVLVAAQRIAGIAGRRVVRSGRDAAGRHHQSDHPGREHGHAPDSGSVQVALVASVTPTFTLGSSIVALYTVDNIPAVSETPTKGNYKTFAKNIVNSAPNVVTISGSPVTLPTSPTTYYLGVVVDPYGKLTQLSLPSNVFSLSHKVGPGNSGSGLPPAGVVSTTGNTSPFPIAPNGQIIGNV